jgi:hypothetical protein
MTRDQRDPIKLGEMYLDMRSKGVDIETAIRMPAENYQNGKYISSDPADHHSKVDQTLGDLSE